MTAAASARPAPAALAPAGAHVDGPVRLPRPPAATATATPSRCASRASAPQRLRRASREAVKRCAPAATTTSRAPPRPSAFLLGDHAVIFQQDGQHKETRRLMVPPFHGERMRAYGADMARFTDDMIDSFATASGAPAQAASGVDAAGHPALGVRPRRRAALGELARHIVEYLDAIMTPWFYGATLVLSGARVRDFLRSRGKACARSDGAHPPAAIDRRSRRRHRRHPVRRDRALPRARRRRARARPDILAHAGDGAARRRQPARRRGAARSPDDAAHRRPRDDGHVADAGPSPARCSTRARWSACAPRSSACSPTASTRPRSSSSPTSAPSPTSRCASTPSPPRSRAVSSTTCSSAGYTLPAGTRVSPCIYLAQRDPRVWDDPQRFRPERFLEGKASVYEFFPFGAGVWRCLGAQFAEYEMRVVLARLVARAELDARAGHRARARCSAASPSRRRTACRCGSAAARRNRIRCAPMTLLDHRSSPAAGLVERVQRQLQGRGHALWIGHRLVSQALVWATVTQLAGSLLTLRLAAGLVKAFSAKGLVPDAVAASPRVSRRGRAGGGADGARGDAAGPAGIDDPRAHRRADRCGAGDAAPACTSRCWAKASFCRCC